MTGRPLRRGLAVTAAVAMIALSGCGQNEPNPAQNVEKPSIRVGVPDTVDAAPLYLARQAGYFTEVGLNVDIIVTAGVEATLRLTSVARFPRQLLVRPMAQRLPRLQAQQPALPRPAPSPAAASSRR